MPMSDREAEVRDGVVEISGAVEFTGLSRAYLYRLMSGGELSYLKVGTRRLIPRAALTRYLADKLAATTGARH
jgi:excisionase family DNA binding protein